MSSTEHTLDSSKLLVSEEGNLENEGRKLSTPAYNGNTRVAHHFMDNVYSPYADRMDLSSIPEYEENFSILEKEVQNYKRELQELKSDIVQLVTDNDKLNKELRYNVEARLSSQVEPHSDVISMQKKLEIVTDAKESILKMWHIALQEVERLERELEKYQGGSDFSVFEKRTAELQRDYTKAIELLNTELNLLRKNSDNAKENLFNIQMHANDLQKTNAELAEELKGKDKRLKHLEEDIIKSQHRVLELEEVLEDTKRRKDEAEEQTKAANGLNEAFKERIETLLALHAELEASEASALERAKESVRLAEAAIIEKDVAIFREHQAMKEVEGLQKAMDRLVESAADQTKAVVNEIKKKFNGNIEKLIEEIKNLQIANNEKQAKVERAIREKRATESELESMYREAQGGAESPLLEELSQKLMRTQQERDCTVLKLEVLESTLKTTSERLEEDVKYYKAETEQLIDRLQKAEENFQICSEEKVELINQIFSLESQTREYKDENSRIKKKWKEDSTKLESNLNEHRNFLKHQLMESNVQHEATIRELRELLISHQRIENKWKEEAHQLTSHFEVEIKKTTDTLRRVESENAHLKKSLKENRRKIHRMEETIKRQSIENSKLHQQVALVEGFNKVPPFPRSSSEYHN